MSRRSYPKRHPFLPDPGMISRRASTSDRLDALCGAYVGPLLRPSPSSSRLCSMASREDDDTPVPILVPAKDRDVELDTVKGELAIALVTNKDLRLERDIMIREAQTRDAELSRLHQRDKLQTETIRSLRDELDRVRKKKE